MRIDAHVHFIDPVAFEYPWMPPEPSVLRRAWMPDDLRPVLARNKFDGCVAVQAFEGDRETDLLLQLADQHSFILGVVGWVDLTSPDLPHRLDALQRHPKFAGVRYPFGENLDGLRELERRQIPFDLLVRPDDLKLIPRIAERVPSLPMIVDHIAKPPIASGATEPWARDIEAVSRIHGMHVKISGMITEAEWKTWLPSQLAPYVQHVWRLFGPERCLFGSDWPVCLQAGIWKEVLAGFTQALGAVDKETRAGIMGENAIRFYRLPRKS